MCKHNISEPSEYMLMNSCAPCFEQFFFASYLKPLLWNESIFQIMLQILVCISQYSHTEHDFLNFIFCNKFWPDINHHQAFSF
jgi:hypothetical protein